MSENNGIRRIIEPAYILPNDGKPSNPLENTVVLDVGENRLKRALVRLERLVGYRYADYVASCGFISERYVDVVNGDSSMVVRTCSKTNGCMYDYIENHNRRVAKEIADKRALYESHGFLNEVSVAHIVLSPPKEVRHLITIDNFDGFLSAMRDAVQYWLDPCGSFNEIDVIPTLHYFGSGRVEGYYNEWSVLKWLDTAWEPHCDTLVYTLVRRKCDGEWLVVHFKMTPNDLCRLGKIAKEHLERWLRVVTGDANYEIPHDWVRKSGRIDVNHTYSAIGDWSYRARSPGYGGGVGNLVSYSWRNAICDISKMLAHGESINVMEGIKERSYIDAKEKIRFERYARFLKLCLEGLIPKGRDRAKHRTRRYKSFSNRNKRWTYERSYVAWKSTSEILKLRMELRKKIPRYCPNHPDCKVERTHEHFEKVIEVGEHGRLVER